MQNQQQFLIDFYAMTDPGQVRSANEDAIYSYQWQRFALDGSPLGEASLFVVADGMGGHANGEEASRRATHAIAKFLVPAVGKGNLDQQELGDLLIQGIKEANKAVIQLNDETGEDGGSTVTAVLVVDGMAYVANVGDSRTYLLRPSDGDLKKITKDHSLVQRLVDIQAIQPEEVYTHPQRNQIYRCLGEKLQVQVDLFTVSLQPSDKLLLCSDGLWGMVRDPQIKDILDSTSDLQQVTGQLITAANANGGADNISAIVVHVHAPFPTGSSPLLNPVDSSTPATMVSALSMMKSFLLPLAACIQGLGVFCGFVVSYLFTRLRGIVESAINGLVAVETDDTDDVLPFVLITGMDGTTHVAHYSVEDIDIRGRFAIPPMPMF